MKGFSLGLLLLASGSGLWAAPSSDPLFSTNGNRFTYLVENNPFYPGLHFPKLTTPQWIGERNVEVAIVLAIDDLLDPSRFETFLRPILDRLKRIDGRAPVSIMCLATDPTNALFAQWLKEGLSLEVHTLDHAHPLLGKSNLNAAAWSYHGSVDLLNRIPGNRPVAMRLPYCDSINDVSPRFFSALFNGVSPGGHFLSIDSSVSHLFTSADPALRRQGVLEANGQERFRKYFPRETNAVTRVSLASFATSIENYPYPYVIARHGWEFPMMTPSDWQASNVNGPTNATTLHDWKAALDAVALKQGVFTFTFHPHGWIRAEQMIAFIDYAVGRYGNKIKFLNFREAQERLDRHLLAGHPLRNSSGHDNGVRLLDLNNDGYLDVLISNDRARRTRIWNDRAQTWNETDGAVPLAATAFGVLGERHGLIALHRDEAGGTAWRCANHQWIEDQSLLNGLELAGQPILIEHAARDRGVRLRDLDRDGRSEFIVDNPEQKAIFAWHEDVRAWKKLSYMLPADVSIVDREGRDNGLRFVDFDRDGYDDLIFSNPEHWAVYLFVPKAVDWLKWDLGWSRKVRSGRPGDPQAPPLIVRQGPHRDNGAWFHSGHLWVQNEDTESLPGHVDRRSFEELIAWDAPPPKPPEEARRAFQLRPGFTIELVAAEPLTRDPVWIDWDAAGRMWVVEMGDYPLGLDGQGKPGGIVRFLEDTNRDGHYDQSTVFLREVNLPNGLMPWRNGVLVSAAPDILYAEDTNGDGRADVRRVLFTGFKEGNPQHRVNGFEYGLDHWLYAANGDSGGMIKNLVDPTRPEVDIRGRDLRFRPDDGAFEAIEGQTQYVRRRDDWGYWFGNNNPVWLWHYWIQERYLRRNPHLPVRTTKCLLANYPNNTRAVVVSPPLQRFNWPDMTNACTAGSAATPYRDELFGPAFADSVFICEPANNLVHHEVLTPNGGSFTSTRPPEEQDREFLASTDPWSRPVNLKVGPDGALYLVDMYRLVIEHPEYGLPGMEKQVDLRAGEDKGRIYRIYPSHTRPRQWTALDKFDTAGLVAAMDSPNGWQRDTVQRLLLCAANREAIAPLMDLFAKTTRAQVRVQILATLEGLGSVEIDLLRRAWRDAHPEVRVQALRASEAKAAQLAQLAALADGLPELAGLVRDPHPHVRYQFVLTLGEPGWQRSRLAAQWLAELALNDWTTPHFQTAILSSAPLHVGAMLETALARAESARHGTLLEQLLNLATAMNDQGALAHALRILPQTQNQAMRFQAIAGLLDALDRRGVSLTQFRERVGSELRVVIPELDASFAIARAVATNAQAETAQRLAAIRLLARGRTDIGEDLKHLTQLLRPQHPVAVQKAALEMLARSRSGQAAALLLDGWMLLSPALRPDAVDVLFSRADWIQQFLDAVEAGRIAPGQVNATQRQKLASHNQAAIRERANKLLSVTNADRLKVLQEYENVSQLRGEPTRGAELFRANCATCHRFHGEGTQLGADLMTLTDPSVNSLLVSILDPNRAVEAPFVNYLATTKDDRELSGVIVSETSTSITLRMAGGVEETVLRSDLVEFKSAGLSIMPEGLESALPLQAMADLLSYILAR